MEKISSKMKRNRCFLVNRLLKREMVSAWVPIGSLDKS